MLIPQACHDSIRQLIHYNKCNIVARYRPIGSVVNRIDINKEVISLTTESI